MGIPLKNRNDGGIGHKLPLSLNTIWKTEKGGRVRKERSPAENPEKCLDRKDDGGDGGDDRPPTGLL